MVANLSYPSLPWMLAAYYLVLSVATFMVYAVDKASARNRGRRIREKTLHLLALCGGWPGALAAQLALRHKSRKPAFQAAYRSTIALNCLVLGWFAYRAWFS